MDTIYLQKRLLNEISHEKSGNFWLPQHLTSYLKQKSTFSTEYNTEKASKNRKRLDCTFLAWKSHNSLPSNERWMWHHCWGKIACQKITQFVIKIVFVFGCLSCWLFNFKFVNIFFAPSISEIVSHVVQVHRDDPNIHIVCDVPGCQCTFLRIFKYKSNLCNRHKDFKTTAPIPIQPNPNPEMQDRNDYFHEENTGVNNVVENNEDRMKRLNALYLLKMKEAHFPSHL